ncbi:MAG: hypothetical protein HOZ81_50430 [Streptomyces sp.]|nr:hypothetical protein [Streptomyces sp.]NUS24392.1 hypothetical protein [Streptomyces sp.]
MITVLLWVSVGWSLLFLYAAREEIADAWRTHLYRAALRSLNSRKDYP